MPAGVRAVGEQINETLTRTPEIRDRKAAEALRGAAKDPEKLDEWARSGETGELVPGSKPTLYEAAGEDRGIGAEQRRLRQGDPVYKIEEEERRAAQNVARVEELKRLGGEGTPEEILTEFRKLRDEMDARTAADEQTAQGAAATAATAPARHRRQKRSARPSAPRSRRHSATSRRSATSFTGTSRIRASRSVRDGSRRPLPRRFRTFAKTRWRDGSARLPTL